jgi:hypothetical protein
MSVSPFAPETPTGLRTRTSRCKILGSADTDIFRVRLWRRPRGFCTRRRCRARQFCRGPTTLGHPRRLSARRWRGWSNGWCCCLRRTRLHTMRYGLCTRRLAAVAGQRCRTVVIADRPGGHEEAESAAVCSGDSVKLAVLIGYVGPWVRPRPWLPATSRTVAPARAAIVRCAAEGSCGGQRI